MTTIREGGKGMPNMEKVIRGLTACRKTNCQSCPYNASGKEDINPICFINEMISDALELLKAQRETIDELISAGKALKLLKEQEAVAPEKEHSGSGITWWNVCGNCKTAINPNDKYCHECGQAVKWE